MYFRIIIINFFLFLTAGEFSAQTCGFGCFGLSGFYAGYGFENYKADGLNEFIKSVNGNLQASESSPEFNTSTGFRLGANIFRAKHKNFLFTAKGYYQFLNAEKDVTEVIDQQNKNVLYSLDLNYWGVGFDVGHILFSFVDIKIIDLAVTFHSADLSKRLNEGGAVSPPEDQFSQNKIGIGYSIGSGLIFRLVGHYISLEATGGYNAFSIDALESQNNEGIKITSTKKLVESGGFFSVLQLNVGIPLD